MNLAEHTLALGALRLTANLFRGERMQKMGPNMVLVVRGSGPDEYVVHVLPADEAQALLVTIDAMGGKAKLHTVTAYDNNPYRRNCLPTAHEVRQMGGVWRGTDHRR